MRLHYVESAYFDGVLLVALGLQGEDVAVLLN